MIKLAPSETVMTPPRESSFLQLDSDILSLIRQIHIGLHSLRQELTGKFKSWLKLELTINNDHVSAMIVISPLRFEIVTAAWLYNCRHTNSNSISSSYIISDFCDR